MRKRLLAIVLTLSMVLSMMTITVTATGTVTKTETEPVTSSSNVAKIGNTEYTSLQEAVNVGGEITLLADIALTEQVKIAEGKEITLDLNGKAITIPQVEGTSPYAIENKGKLTVKDSAGNGSITSRGVDNYGTMVMESGTIIDCDEGGSAVYNEENATFTMNGGTLKATYMGHSDHSTGGACLRNFGTATFNGGTLDSISARTYAIISNGTLTIENVTLTAPRGVAIDNGTAAIKGGTFETFKSAGAAETYPTLYVSSGTEITVSGGTFTVPEGEQPVWNNSSTTISITGGTFTGNMAGKSDYHANSNITVSGGSFSEPVPAEFCAEGATFVVNNGMYTVADLSEAITSGNVEVAVPKAENATSDVSDAVSAIATAIENNSSANVTLTVPVQDATVTFDTSAIQAMAGSEGSVALTVENVTGTASDLPETVGENAVVYDLTLTAGENAVDFSNGSATVTIPNTTGLDTVELWFRTAADGQWTKFEGTVTVTADTITFTTNHFSEWVAAQAAEVDPSAPAAITPSYEWFTSATGDTYTISTVADLVGFSMLTKGAVDDVTTAATTFEGKTVQLANNLTFGENEYWVCYVRDAESTDFTTAINYVIGKGFVGTFDGQNHTISGLKLANYDEQATARGMGLFASLYGTVKNLTVSDVYIYTNNADQPSVICNSVYGKIENCHTNNITIVSGDNGAKNVSGFCRAVQNGGSVKNCSVTNLTVDVASVVYAGGFCTSVNKGAIIENCSVNGAKMYLGDGATSTFGAVGGFASNTQNSTSTVTTFTNCSVTGLEMVLKGTYINANDKNMPGGFIGSLSNDTVLTNCSVSGTIDATNTSADYIVGGFVGDYGWGNTCNFTFTGCTADVNIVANGAAGGFVGQATPPKVNVNPYLVATAAMTDCTANGDVTSFSAEAGGFVGVGDRGTYTDCDATGAVSGVVAGGFWGEITPNVSKAENRTLTITGCDATGSVLGTEAASGFVGTILTTEGKTVNGMEAETIVVINTSTASPVVAGATSETAISTFVQDVTDKTLEGAEENLTVAEGNTKSEEAFKPADEDVTLTMGNNGSIEIPEGTDLVDQNDEPVGDTTPAAVLADRGRSLSLKDLIYINQYAGIDIDGYSQNYIEENGGLLVWNADPGDNAVYGTQNALYEGLTYGGTYDNDTKHEYWAATDGIAAKEYADEYYMCTYLKLTDGSYIYTTVKEYSVQDYCENQLNKTTAKETLKNLCRDMLNYGASAQLYFEYNVNDLANANIKEES